MSVLQVFPIREVKRNSIDGISSRDPFFGCPDLELFQARRSDSSRARSVVFSRGKRVEVISFPKDRYVHSAHSVDFFGEGAFRFSSGKSIDSLHRKDFLLDGKRSSKSLPVFAFSVPIKVLENQLQDFGENLSAGFSGFRLGISSGRVAYVPLMGAMALGMTSAFFLQHSFGKSAAAEEARIVYVDRSEGMVLGDVDEKTVSETEELISELFAEDPDKKEFEKRLKSMVSGYPIEDMVPYILEKDRTVAMFLVAIAKKESNWGKRAPVLEGQDCFNYWGYRGVRKMMGTGGHTCFNSRKDAVDTVAKRLEKLIHENKLDTPEKLILWKCGYSCAGHSSYSVRKWISDVDMYYQKLNRDGV